MSLESLDDITRSLDLSTEKRSLMPKRVERSLPKTEDFLLPEWLPPLREEDVRARIGNKDFTPFRTNVKAAGSELSAPTYLRGKVLDEWTADRCVRPLKAYEKFVKGPDGKAFKPYRYRQQYELLDSWDMDLYANQASLYWLEQPNTHVHDCSRQFQEETARHMPKRERHMYTIYYKQKKAEAENKRFKAAQQAQLVARNSMTDSSPSPQREETRRRTDSADTAASPVKGLPKRSKSEERFLKDSKVRHLDPFKYVNRNYYQLGLSLPYQLPAELLQMSNEYLPDAKRKNIQRRVERKEAAIRAKSEAALMGS